uniref:Uncharacterized protein n=1 Tax=Magallana gigas TaxID=29159 RepID=A0A8W8L4N0_MAGGI
MAVAGDRVRVGGQSWSSLDICFSSKLAKIIMQKQRQSGRYFLAGRSIALGTGWFVPVSPVTSGGSPRGPGIRGLQRDRSGQSSNLTPFSS